MAKKLVVLRNDRSTYEVHVEMGDPPERFVGGQSLDLKRLETELFQHGCPQEAVSKVLQDMNQGNSSTVSL